MKMNGKFTTPHGHVMEFNEFNDVLCIQGCKMGKGKAKGMLVVTLNVSQMNKAKALEYVKQSKKEMCDDRLPDDIMTLWIPVRDRPTAVEYICF